MTSQTFTAQDIERARRAGYDDGYRKGYDDARQGLGTSPVPSSQEPWYCTGQPAPRGPVDGEWASDGWERDR